MFNFTYSEDREKGTYKTCVDNNGNKTANIICPDCGTFLHLFPHKVQADGSVVPSVVCECGFHDFIKLSGWNNNE